MLLSEETASGVALAWAIVGKAPRFVFQRKKQDTGPATYIRVGTHVETGPKRISRGNHDVET